MGLWTGRRASTRVGATVMSHLVATATGMWTGCGGGLRFCRSKRVFLSSHFNGQMHGVEIEDSNDLVAVLTIQSSCVIWSSLNG